jgi:transposase-like protein
MRKGRFTDEHMVAIIRTDREPVPTVAKRHGISEQTIYTWRSRRQRSHYTFERKFPYVAPFEMWRIDQMQTICNACSFQCDLQSRRSTLLKFVGLS